MKKEEEIKIKEYNEAMKDMACWEAKVHVEKCDRCKNELFKQEKQKWVEEIEKLPKYDLSKNGIDGEFYLKKEDILETIK